MEIILNGKDIKDQKDLFITLKKQINNPLFVGNNLDALWDVLSTTKEEIITYLYNIDELTLNLGDYAKSLLKLFKDLKEYNPKNKLYIK